MAFFFTGELLEVLEVAKQIDPAGVVGIAGTGLWEHACGPLELWVSALHSNLSQLLACSGSVSPADASSVTTVVSFFVLKVWCRYGYATDVAQITERDFILVCHSKLEHSSLNSLPRE